MEKNILAAFAAVMMACGMTAQVVNAQEQAPQLNLSVEQAAVLASLPGNAQTTSCSTVLYHFDQGKLTSVEVEKHSGVSLRTLTGIALMSGESQNWGDLSATTALFGAAVTVTHHRKNWPVDLLAEGYAALNTSATVETLSVSAFEAGFTGMVGFNPCGNVKFYVGGTLAYVNSTSRFIGETESYKIDIPYQGNALFYGPSARLAVKIFSINSTKNVNGVKITKHHPVSLVVDGKYMWGSVGEPSGSTAKERRAEITLGLQFALF